MCGVFLIAKPIMTSFMNKVLRMLSRFYATNAPIFLQRRKYTERARVAYDTLVDGRQKSHIVQIDSSINVSINRVLGITMYSLEFPLPPFPIVLLV